MSKQRAQIGFDSTFDELDPDEWKPAAPEAAAVPKPPKEQIRKVAKSAGFESREAAPPSTLPEATPITAKPVRKRQPYTTGRNIQTNIKTRLQDDTEFKDISAHFRWPQGYTFQRAIEALKRELQAKGELPPALGKTA